VPATVTQAPTPTGTATAFPPDTNPLTGLKVDDAQILERRAVAVKISNGPRTIRPQWGLSFADHVYEYYQESGRTRYNAIFYGQDAQQAGPIRSARFADEHFVRMYKAVFAFGSADYRVRDLLFASDFADRLYSVTDFPCPPTVDAPLCRWDPNNLNYLVANTAYLSQYFSNAGVANGRQDLRGLNFSHEPPQDGTPGTNMVVRYSISYYARWEYDSSNGVYYRSQDTIEAQSGHEQYALLTDRLTGEPVVADNVIMLFAPHAFYSEDPEIIEIDFIGTGDAILFRDGQAYQVKWSRLEEEDLFSFYFPDQRIAPLKPGKTWFQILGTTSSTVDNSPNWRFSFWIP
jgi:hypothetical protein